MYDTDLVQTPAYGVSFGTTMVFDERNDCRWRFKRREVRLRL